MLLNLKLKIANYLLLKEMKSSSRQSNVITLANAKRIGVLFDASSEISICQIKLLLKYFLKKNIDVEILGYVNNNKMDHFHLSSLHINYFNLNDLTLLGFPKSKKTIDFLTKKFDIVINLSLYNTFPTKYLVFKTDAKFKIGVFNNQNIMKYDLLLKLKVKSIDYLIEQLTYYLELITKNNEK